MLKAEQIVFMVTISTMHRTEVFMEAVTKLPPDEHVPWKRFALFVVERQATPQDKPHLEKFFEDLDDDFRKFLLQTRLLRIENPGLTEKEFYETAFNIDKIIGFNLKIGKN